MQHQIDWLKMLSSLANASKPGHHSDKSVVKGQTAGEEYDQRPEPKTNIKVMTNGW